MFVSRREPVTLRFVLKLLPVLQRDHKAASYTWVSMPRRKATADASISRLQRETLNDRAYRELKHLLMTGVFKPGQILTLRNVAEAMGTSLMPVRDAMNRLVTERAFEMRPSRKIGIPVLTVDQFMELRRIRILLEGDVVALAAKTISPRQLTKVKAIDRKIRDLKSEHSDQFWALNLNLHFAIYEAGGGPLMLSIIHSLWHPLGPLITLVPSSIALKASVDPHRQLMKALEGRDSKAARAALEADLEQTGDEFLKLVAVLGAKRT